MVYPLLTGRGPTGNMEAKLFVGALLVVAIGAGCTSSTMPLGDVAAQAVSASVREAARPYDRRQEPDYRRHVQASRWACQTAESTRLVVPDGDAHLRADDPAVRVVRYADCKVEWLDDCRLRKPATYRAVELGADGRRAESIVVSDEIDLYERLPAFSSKFGHRMTQPTSMRVEIRTFSLRESAMSFARSDLDTSDACAGATHWIAAIEHGALRVNFDASSYAGESELEAQKTLGVGSYAACVRAEPGACEAPVAIRIVPLRGATL